MNLKNIVEGRIFVKRRMILLGLVLLTLATFWRVREMEFINVDDNLYVYDNPHLQGGLTWSGIKWAFGADLLFSTRNADYWQPMTFLSRMLDVSLFGMNPAGHHLMNLLFHLLNTLLLFHVLRKMTGQAGRSAMVAALFAVHPLHVESVAWVTERKDVLSGFFWMLTLWAYGNYSSGRRRSALFSTRGASSACLAIASERRRVERRTFSAWYNLTLLFFALGLMSKPMVITLPFVLILLDYWPLRRPLGNPETWLEKVPLMFMSLISIAITFPYQGKQLRSPSPGLAIENSMVGYGTYFVKTIWPHPLAIQYARLPGAPPMEAVFSSVLLLAIISCLCLRWARSFPFLMVGWLWFLGTLVPVIHLNDITGADRFTYLPLIGLFMAMVWGGAECGVRSVKCGFRSLRFGHRPFSLQQVLAGGVLGVFSLLSFHQLGYWKNTITLLEHSAAVTSNSYLVHNNLAVALLHKGKVEGAIHYFDQAIQGTTNSADVLSNLGVSLARNGNLDEAIQSFESALALDPKHFPSFIGLGSALNNTGHRQEAMEQFERAIQIEPDSSLAHANLGFVLSLEGRNAEAVSEYRLALKNDPRNVEALNNLGNALFKMGKLNEAVQSYLEAIQVRPDYPQAWFNLGNILTLRNRFKEAAECYSLAVQFDPRYAMAHYNLGICLARLNHPEGAVQHLRKAVELNPDFAPAREELKKWTGQEEAK